eukprot:5599772-Amphidinium_carterae.1
MMHPGTPLPELYFRSQELVEQERLQHGCCVKDAAMGDSDSGAEDQPMCSSEKMTWPHSGSSHTHTDQCMNAGQNHQIEQVVGFHMLT